MGFKNFKISKFAIFLIVTQKYHFTLAQDPPSYIGTDNNYVYNNDYSYGNDYQSNTIVKSGENVAYPSEQLPVTDQPEPEEMEESPEKGALKAQGNVHGNNCWMSLNAAAHFKAMDDLDEKYNEVKQNYQLNVADKIDKQMLDELLSSRGAAPRTIHKFGGDSLQIPAGINLGRFGMMRQLDSLLFFHRMKLRNSTNFQMNYLHNDLENMCLIARIGLNDLHLVGAYERSPTHKDSSVLYYRPSYGTVELLLKNVDYKMEARLRMMSDRITIDLINSELLINDEILMSYLNTNSTVDPDYTLKVQKRNLDDFLQRLKADLDLWLKDFFNDFLMYYELPEYDNTQFQEYQKFKTIFLNEYANYAINTIRQKIYNLAPAGVRLPKFTIFSVPNMVLRLKDGVLRGLDTMFQRSVGTGVKHNDVRLVDVVVGFSKLRAEYQFEAVLPNGSPPLTGFLVLSANEMTANLAISLVKEPESVDLSFDSIQQMKAESLAVEGPANRLIANFKHHLEHQIIALMSNAMVHNIKMLNTITRCVPYIYGQAEKDPYLKENLETNGESLRNSKKSKAKSRSIGKNKTWKGPQKYIKRSRNIKKQTLRKV